MVYLQLQDSESKTFNPLFPEFNEKETKVRNNTEDHKIIIKMSWMKKKIFQNVYRS